MPTKKEKLGTGDAFPNDYKGWPGMSIRTYLAGQALNGLCAGRAAFIDNDQAKSLSTQALRCADAMLEYLGDEW